MKTKAAHSLPSFHSADYDPRAHLDFQSDRSTLTSCERERWLKNKANLEVLLYKLKCGLQCFKTNKELDIVESQDYWKENHNQD